MDPLTLAFLGSTALSGIGGLLGAGASSKNTKQLAQMGQQAAQAQRENTAQQAMFRNQDLARINQGQAESMPMLQSVWAQALQNAQGAQAGMTTGAGSRVYFDPNMGWTTSLGPQDQREQEARARESVQANQLLDELKGLHKEDPSRLRDILYARSAAGLEDSFRGAREAGMRGAVRSGNDRLGGAILADLGRAQSKELSNAALDAEIKAPDIAQQRFDSQRNNLAQLYQAFSGAAGKESSTNKLIPQFAGLAGDANKSANAIGLNVAGTPLNAATSAAGIGVQGGANVNNANKILEDAFKTQGGLTNPDMGMANAFTSIGQLGGNTANLLYNRNQYSQSQDYADRLKNISRQTGLW